MKISDRLHAPAALSPGKDPPVPIFRRLGGFQSRSRHQGVEKHLLSMPAMEFQLVAELSLLRKFIPVLNSLIKHFVMKTYGAVEV
jgi:hypothetical protein